MFNGKLEEDADDFRYKMTNTRNMEPMCFLITMIIQNQYFDDELALCEIALPGLRVSHAMTP